MYVCVCSPAQVKCDQYWPTRGTESYGLVHVTLVDVVELATYTVRTFQLMMVMMLTIMITISSQKLNEMR